MTPRPRILHSTLLLFILLGDGLAADIVRNPDAFSPNPSDYSENVVLFYSEACGVCRKAMEYLDGIAEDQKELGIFYFEMPDGRQGPVQDLFEAFRTRTGTGKTGVPRIFMNGKAFLGFSDSEREPMWIEQQNAWLGSRNVIEEEIEVLIGAPVSSGKTTRFDWFQGFVAAALFALLLYSVIRSRGRLRWMYFAVFCLILGSVLVLVNMEMTGLIGLVDRLPFPVFVAAIALADGFNPCAFTALFLMLSVLAGLDSPSLTGLVGGIFASISGIMYFIFMIVIILGESLVFSFIGINLYRVVGVVVGGAGILNLIAGLDSDIGLRLGADSRGLFAIGRRTAAIRRLAGQHRSFSRDATIVLAAVFLAAMVNVIELGCTAILPGFYAGVLLGRYGPSLGILHVAYSAVYAAIYVLPLIAILISFLLFSKSRRMSPQAARSMKLAAAAVMIPMGGLLLLNPGLLFS